LCVDVPDRDAHVVRYVGWSSNRARTIGYTLPPELRLCVDRVIE